MESIGVKVSSRGYIVLPARLRKEMNIKAGSRVILTKEDDKLVLQPVSSFTEKLSGLTKHSFGKSADEVNKYIKKVREDR